MIKKKLLAMPQLYATREMLKIAADNKIETKSVTHKGMYGKWEHKEEYSEYGYYFRASVQDGILKVAAFTQRILQKGDSQPVLEIFCDKSSDRYITYDCRDDKWRTGKIDNLLWDKEHSGIRTKKNFQSQKDRNIVNDYLQTGINRDIYTAVLDFQSGIKEEKLKKKHRSEIEQIDEVMREVPEIPKDFMEWIAKNAFEEYLFYEPGKNQKMYCTHCGRWMPKPADNRNVSHGEKTICPKCRTEALYKSWNKQKYIRSDQYVGLLQRLRDDSGYILRGFECRIKRRHDIGWDKHELTVNEMQRVKLSDEFVRQEYFEYGEYKYTGVNRWKHAVRIYGYYHNEHFGLVIMYTSNLKKVLKKEKFCNADMKSFFLGGKRKRVDAERLLRILYENPFIEYLQKSGLSNLVDEIRKTVIEKRLFNREAKTMAALLRLDKQRYERLKSVNGNKEILQALQYELVTGSRISDANMQYIINKGVIAHEAVELSERTGMSLQRTLNYLERQQEITGQDFRSIYNHYKDYLDMAEIFGMDIRDEIVCRQPKMMEYHDRYLERKNKKENQYRDKEVNVKYPEIKKNVKRNEERFGFSTKEYIIMVPQQASDITKEGRQQHHCVGASDTYIRQMNGDITFILFLRKKSAPKKAYYTLQVKWDGSVLQAYGAYDRKPDWETVEKVLKKFTEKVRKRDQKEKVAVQIAI